MGILVTSGRLSYAVVIHDDLVRYVASYKRYTDNIIESSPRIRFIETGARLRYLTFVSQDAIEKKITMLPVRFNGVDIIKANSAETESIGYSVYHDVRAIS